MRPKLKFALLKTSSEQSAEKIIENISWGHQNSINLTAQ